MLIETKIRNIVYPNGEAIAEIDEKRTGTNPYDKRYIYTTGGTLVLYVKIINFLLLSFFFLACEVNSTNKLIKNIEASISKTNEYQVIKILFNNVKLDELKKERFGVIIYFDDGIFSTMESRPNNFLAWFKYNHDNNYTIVNYFSFPVQEKFTSTNDGKNQFDIFLDEIVNNKKILNLERAKQLKIKLPTGLQNDLLFNEMNKYKYQDMIKNGLESIHTNNRIGNHSKVDEPRKDNV